MHYAANGQLVVLHARLACEGNGWPRQKQVLCKFVHASTEQYTHTASHTQNRAGAAQLFQNTAAALPAELGPDGSYESRQKRRQFRMLNPTRAALAWHKRLMAQKQRSQVCDLRDLL